MIKSTKSNSPVNLLDGSYHGTLSGYEVVVRIKPALSLDPSHKLDVRFSVEDGIRGTVECKVIVTNGRADITY